MSSSDQDFWLRELARTGLSASDRKELLTALTNAVADREKYFPPAPSPYLCRARRNFDGCLPSSKGTPLRCHASRVRTGITLPQSMLVVGAPGIFPSGRKAPAG